MALERSIMTYIPQAEDLWFYCAKYINVGEKERRNSFAFSLFLFIQTLKIMGKGGRVRGKVTVRRKPKMSSNNGGFLVAKVSAVNKKPKIRNG